MWKRSEKYCNSLGLKNPAYHEAILLRGAGHTQSLNNDAFFINELLGDRAVGLYRYKPALQYYTKRNEFFVTENGDFLRGDKITTKPGKA